MFTGLRRVWNGLNCVYPLGNPKANANMNPDYSNTPPSTGSGGEGSPESEESQPDMVLDYINKMLMEEEEFNNIMYNNHLDDALQAAEKSFSDVIAEANSSSPIQPPVYGESSGDAYFSNSNYTNDEIEFVDALLFADGDQAMDSVSYSSQLIPNPLSNQLTTGSLSDGYSFQLIPGPLSNQLTTAPCSDGYSSQPIPGPLRNQLTTTPLSDGYSSQQIPSPLSNGQSSQPIPLSNSYSSQLIPSPLSNQLIPGPLSNSYSSQPIPSSLSNGYSSQLIPGRLSNGYSSQPVPGPLNNGSSDLQFVSKNAPDLFYDSLPVWQFNKGAEEASKFLPDTHNLFKNMEANGNGFTPNLRGDIDVTKHKSAPTVVLPDKKSETAHFTAHELMARKHTQLVNLTSDNEIQRRRYKQSGDNFCPALARLEDFDSVLLCDGMDDSQSTLKLKESMQNELKSMNLNGAADKESSSSNGRKSKGKKRQPKKEVFDLQNVLIQCAQSVAADDTSTANQLMKKIKQHSYPVGDGSQRLAHYFADALEARLSGKGNQTYHSLQVMRVTAAEILMAYRMYMATCPFEKVSHFFTNETILKVVGNANNIHIVEFGIGFGFQWPSFMEKLSRPDGKPPKLRITAIDAPQAGHRPAERVEQTGRQLADYAHTFGIPFKYNSFSCDWETIRAEDLAIKGDEVVVCCLHGLETVADESVIIDSPRDAVLNNIREMNPAVFVHRITNGSYGAPVFVNRFREAFFHFSAVFNMIDATMPRGSPERACIEMEVHGREIMNVIACEDKERVQRPEAYKQCKMRIGRAGFSQLPLDTGIMRNAKEKFRSAYNKEFLIDNDSNWLLQGWKGRTLYAISTWKLPNAEK